MISMVIFNNRNMLTIQWIELYLLGNGFIEGRELDCLLRELASSVNVNDTGPEVSVIVVVVVVIDESRPSRSNHRIL
jgi:hypothetical protein